jgi:hypothetical protein
VHPKPVCSRFRAQERILRQNGQVRREEQKMLVSRQLQHEKRNIRRTSLHLECMSRESDLYQQCSESPQVCVHVWFATYHLPAFSLTPDVLEYLIYVPELCMFTVTHLRLWRHLSGPQDNENENPRDRSGSAQVSALSPPNPTNRSHRD